MNASSSTAPLPNPTLASWMVVLVGGILCAPASVPVPVLPAIAAHFADPSIAQLVMTMPALGVIVGAFASGPLMDRVGLRTLLVATIIGLALCGALPMVQESRTALIAGRAFTGFFSAIAGAVTLGWIAMAHADRARARLIGFQSALSVAVAVLAVPIAGMLGERWGWRAPFAIYLMMLVCLPLVAMHDLRVPRATERTGEATHAAVWNLWPVFLLIGTLACVVLTGGIVVPFRLSELGVNSPETLAWLTTLAGLPAIATSAAFGYIVARTTAPWLHAIVLAPIGVGLVFAGTASGVPAMLAGLALHSAGVGLQGPYTSTMLFARATPGQYGRAAAMIGPSFFAGQFAAGGVVVAAQQSLGVAGTLIALGLTVTCGAAIAVAATRFAARDPVPPQPSRVD